MDIYKKYVQIFLGLFLLLGVFLSAFNIIIDPYSYFNIVEIQGFNDKKDHRLMYQERITKPYDFLRGEYDKLIIGTSRANRLNGLSFFNPKDVFDFSLLQASPMEKFYALKFSLNNSNAINDVLVSLDFDLFLASSIKSNVLFNAEDVKRFSDEGFYFSDLIRFLIAVDTLRDSVETIRSSIEGMRKYEKLDKVPQYFFHESEKNFLIKFWLPIRDRHVFAQKNHKGFEWLQRIIDLSIDRGVDLKFIILPTHARSYEYFHELGLVEEYQKWKMLLVEWMEESASNSIQLWDFSGYSAYNCEEMPLDSSSKKLKYHKDSAHMTAELGYLVLDRIYNKESKIDFGVLLNRNTIDQVFDDFEMGHNRYLEESMAQVMDVREVLAKIK